MKRLSSLVILAAFAFGLAAPALFGDEMTEVYRQIYEQSTTLQDKYNAVQNLIALDDRSVAPILSDALEELLRTQDSYRTATDKTLYGRTVQLVASGLGQYKYGDAASFLWDVVQQVPDPLAQAEALMALGRMRALDYADRVAKMLSDLDLTPTADADSGEKLAFGCIVALDKLKAPQGFAPVFYASDGWYSQRIKQLALKSLPDITDDPTDAVALIVRTEGVDRKVRALQLELGSAAPAERKSATAIQALAIGHLQADPNRPAEAKAFAELRKTALRGLVQLRAADPAAVDPESQSYAKGYDDEERLLALQALGLNGGDQAAKVLADILKTLNGDVRNGLLDESRTRMARAAIAAALNTKNPGLRAPLMLIANNNLWSGSVINDANAALKAFK